ncbi:MAG: FAD-binding protein [Planctomycetes bacterium]|nr:FAD-binding protein [Planctomycetota bacterium]
MDAPWIAELRALLGPRGIVEDPTRLFPYEADGIVLLRRRPELVLLPRTTEQVSRALKILHRERVPVVARGAGTGLSGGATPVEGGVVVSLARMRDVLELDAVDRTARVQAGLVNIDLSLACSKHQLFYAPDPSSQQACTLGGNIAENSGGPHCFRYGNTTQHVLGLVIVLEDGTVLDLSEPRVDPLGYDLVGLFVGSEGMFGIATELVLKLLPKPATTETLLAIFESLDAACDATSDLIRARHEPSAIEILDKLTIQAVEASVYAAGYPKTAEAVLLLDIEGSEVEVANTVAGIEPLVRARGAIEVRTAKTELERKQLWAGRKGAFGAMGRIAPDLYVADVCVPRTKLRELVAHTTRIAREKNLKLATVFHAGDGNLHPNIAYDRRDADEVRRVLEAGDEIMHLCIEAGGSLSGEHGVGLEKMKAMEWLFTREDLATMCRVREAWDPDRRMNPGKLIPIRACLETKQAVFRPEHATGAAKARDER